MNAHLSDRGIRVMLVVAPILFAMAVSACSPTGSLGTVPSAPPSTVPSVVPGGPDLTPGPSFEPSATPVVGGPSDEPSSEPSQSPGPTQTVVVRAYFVFNGEPGVEGLVPTLRNVPATAAVARAAMGVLLDGPQQRTGAATLSSAIPSGTTLLDLSIRNGTATVDLSREFESGGGSASSLRRLGQVVYTLTQFSTVRGVLFQVEGRTVTTFGSEGVVLDGPQTRADFVGLLPSMFVDRPAFGAAAGNPARITGSADVFEATFRIAILDGAGRTIADQQAMATCGSGCRGTFDVSVSYKVAKAQWGILRVYDPSEKDGSPQDIRDYPVWLTPAG
jgi:sporulation and spore germination protein/immunoglobulin-like protein involved in spore germination